MQAKCLKFESSKSVESNEINFAIITPNQVRRGVVEADGGDGADSDRADHGGEGGRPEEAGHRHLPRPRTQLPLQLLGDIGGLLLQRRGWTVPPTQELVPQFHSKAK